MDIKTIGTKHEILGYGSRGHQDKEAFAAEITRRFDPGKSCHAFNVEHLYLFEGNQCALYDKSVSGRSTSPVTWWCAIPTEGPLTEADETTEPLECLRSLPL